MEAQEASALVAVPVVSLRAEGVELVEQAAAAEGAAAVLEGVAALVDPEEVVLGLVSSGAA